MSRVEGLEKELGMIVTPEPTFRIRKASITDFIKHVEKVIYILKTVDTSEWNLRTRIFVLALYLKPPSLAFVRANVRGLVGEVVVATTKNRYTMSFDNLSELFGSKKSKQPYKPSRIMTNYIPVSADYLILKKDINGNWVYKVTYGNMRWYVYKSKDAVLANIQLLQMFD